MVFYPADCRCGGSNERCRYCFGTGYLNTNRNGAAAPPIGAGVKHLPTSATAETAARPAPRTPRQVRDPHQQAGLGRERCEQCGRFFAANQLSIHQVNEHPSKPIRGTRVSDASADPCELVYAHLPEDWDSSSSVRRVSCPLCGKGMKHDILPRHLQRIHDVRNPFVKVARGSLKSSGPAGPSSVDDSIRTEATQNDFGPGDALAEELRHRDVMDGSRKTYVRREQGRFGSHPTHDRFDDDSNP